MNAITQESRIKLFFFISALLLLGVAVLKIDNLLVSLILAFVVSYMLSPFVDFLERRGFSRTLSVVIPFVCLTLALVITIQIFAPALIDQLQSLQENIPQYMRTGTEFLKKLEAKLTLILKSFSAEGLNAEFQTKALGWATGFFKDLPDYLSKSLIILLLSPLLAFFMLLDGRDFVRKLLVLAPNRVFELSLNLQHQIGSQLGGFIRARFVQSALVAVVIWFGLMVLNFPYALLLAVVAGVLNIIPYVGPLVAFFPPLIICFANGGNGTQVAGIAFVYSLAQVLDAALITPFVVAKIVNLHPITVIIVILAGGQVGGMLGLIICIPVFSILKVSTESIYKHLTDFRS